MHFRFFKSRRGMTSTGVGTEHYEFPQMSTVIREKKEGIPAEANTISPP